MWEGLRIERGVLGHDFLGIKRGVVDVGRVAY